MSDQSARTDWQIPAPLAIETWRYESDGSGAEHRRRLVVADGRRTPQLRAVLAFYELGYRGHIDFVVLCVVRDWVEKRDLSLPPPPTGAVQRS